MQTDSDLAHILWDYNHLNHDLKPADFIFVMCSYNLDVAHRAYELFQDNMGEFIVTSGGVAHQDDLLNTNWEEAEAIVFQNRLLDLGVPQDKIIVEDKATNCGENIQFTKSLLKDKSLSSGLLVQKPYMERRAFATASKQWADMSWQVTSPDIRYHDYVDNFGEEKTINLMVGDTLRMIDYAEKGFQTYQEMPEKVENCFKQLINKGYDKHI